MRRTRILALDFGTNLGWAVRSKDGYTVLYGTHTFQAKGLEGGGMRWLRFRNWLAQMHEDAAFEALFFEEVVGFPPKNKGRDAKTYHGFASVMSEFCERYSIPYKGVGVGTIKKFITGNGNAGKPAVIAEVQRLGYDPQDSNQADAIALLLYAEEVGCQ